MISIFVEKGVVTNVIVGEAEGYIPYDGEVGIGWTYVDGVCAAPPAVPLSPELLEAFKAVLKNGIDAAAETERLKYITAGAGQAMTYQQKNDEATRFLAASDPDPTDYPLLSAEVGITADDIAAVAVLVRNAYAQWQLIGAAIEGTRLGAKKAIDQTDTSEAAQAAYAAVNWPSPGA